MIRISVRLRNKFSTQILFCSSTSFFSDHYYHFIPCNFVLILTVIQYHQSLDTICTYLLSESSHFWGAQSKQKKIVRGDTRYFVGLRFRREIYFFFGISKGFLHTFPIFQLSNYVPKQHDCSTC